MLNFRLCQNSNQRVHIIQRRPSSQGIPMYTWMVPESSRSALYGGVRLLHESDSVRLCVMFKNVVRVSETWPSFCLQSFWANFQMPGAARTRLASAGFVIVRLLIDESELCRRFTFVKEGRSYTVQQGSLGIYLRSDEY